MIRSITQRVRNIFGNSIDRSASDTPELIRTRLAKNTATGHLTMCNLGCGSRHHPDWINLDFHGDGSSVFSWDLQQGLPLPDRSCDVIYSSHAIEHFTRDGASRFLTECRRVLKSGGTLRVVAPDLEGITRAYLACLEAARSGATGAADRYEWITIELLDQLVRHSGGGEMLKYWAQESVPAEDFVAARVGTEYRRARTYWKGRPVPERTLNAYEVGRFRLGGEVHQWMYDSYSLERLLSECGYVDPHSCSAGESAIPSFATYGLDTEPDGSTYKPDSFFIEAKAP
jgi:predicted SAM-dependent methyltransferase